MAVCAWAAAVGRFTARACPCRCALLPLVLWGRVLGVAGRGGGGGRRALVGKGDVLGSS